MARPKKPKELTVVAETTPLTCPECKGMLYADWSTHPRKLLSMHCKNCSWRRDIPTETPEPDPEAKDPT